MKLAEINNSVNFAKSNNTYRGNNCCPKPKMNPSYRDLLVENILLHMALRDASRIIAVDADKYVRSR